MAIDAISSHEPFTPMNRSCGANTSVISEEKPIALGDYR
jgi:hypothetical protein